MSARRRAAPTTSSGMRRTSRNPSARRRAARRPRRRLGQARKPRRRDDAARADHRAGRAGRRLYDVPPSRHAGERRHHRLFGLGDQLPGIQGDGGPDHAVERPERLAGAIRRAGPQEPPRRGHASRPRSNRVALPVTHVARSAWRRRRHRGRAHHRRKRPPSRSPITAAHML